MVRMRVPTGRAISSAPSAFSSVLSPALSSSTWSTCTSEPTTTRSFHHGYRLNKISYGILPSNDEWLCLLIARAMSGSASLQPWPSWLASQNYNLVFTTPLACSIRPCICGCLALPLMILIPYFFSNIRRIPLNSAPLSYCNIRGIPTTSSHWAIHAATPADVLSCRAYRKVYLLKWS